MKGLLGRAGRRYLRQHPWLLGLSVLGVALGVAVVVGIDLANGSARRAFERSAETVTGRATHQIIGATGRGLDEALYGRLRREWGVREAAPVVEGYVTGADGRPFQVLGVDPFAEAPFRPYVARGLDPGAFMARPGTVLMAASAAARRGLAPGDTFAVRAEGVRHTLTVAGLLTTDGAPDAEALSGLLVADVGTAQELLGRVGRLSRIDLRVPGGPAGEALLARLTAALPGGVTVARSATRTRTVAQMSRAFEVNLTALSLLALVVGMFLIYNTMTFSVVQRRPLIGRLRALGVTRREVFFMVLGEALLIGGAGTVVGGLLGLVLGNGLVHLVTRTINDLYYVVTVRQLVLTPVILLKGIGLGVGATVLAALAPAREATAAPAAAVLQRSQEESRMRRRAPALALTGLGLGALGAASLAWAGQGLVQSYLALFAVLMAFALLTPAAVVGMARGLTPVMGRAFGLPGRMAARGLTAALSRTGVAVAALMIALAATIGVGVMVDSFRQTVSVWLGYALQADVYVQPPSLVVRQGDAWLRPEVVRRLIQTPGVAAAYSVRRVTVAAPDGPAQLVAIDAGPRTAAAFRFKQGKPAAAWAAFDDGSTVLVSEPYAFRHHLDVGDTLRLQSDRGLRAFVVRGVYYDYASDQGVVLMSRATYERYYDDRERSGLALYAEPGVEVPVLVERLRARVAGLQSVFIRSNRALRDASLEVFDRTFTVTVVLRLLAVLVAFVGVMSALMALQLEQARTVAVLRANGMTPGQVGGLVTLQTGLMGLVAGVLSMPLGLALAFLLIHVINRRSFGWTMQMDLSPGVPAQALLLALVAALLAGLYPAWRMARAHPARALREP